MGKFDYEGFFVMFLERDLSLGKHYTGWQGYTY